MNKIKVLQIFKIFNFYYLYEIFYIHINIYRNISLIYSDLIIFNLNISIIIIFIYLFPLYKCIIMVLNIKIYLKVEKRKN